MPQVLSNNAARIEERRLRCRERYAVCLIRLERSLSSSHSKPQLLLLIWRMPTIPIAMAQDERRAADGLLGAEASNRVPTRAVNCARELRQSDDVKWSDRTSVARHPDGAKAERASKDARPRRLGRRPSRAASQPPQGDGPFRYGATKKRTEERKEAERRADAVFACESARKRRALRATEVKAACAALPLAGALVCRRSTIGSCQRDEGRWS